MTIYHNPRCAKSRETLKLIKDAGKDVEVREYLKTPPTADELRDVLLKLNLPVEYLIRKNEDLYKTNFKGKEFSDDEWIKILADNPQLIERPIVVQENEAVLGRPPENVQKFF